MEIKTFDFNQLTLSTARQDSVFVWIDIETGGLNGLLENNQIGAMYYPIFEVALKVTDKDLNEICDPLCMTIYQDEDDIAKCSEWALKTHAESGLLNRVRNDGVELVDAEAMILEHLSSNGVNPYNVKAKSGGVLAGNGIHYDRSFIMCQMPRLNSYLYYRQNDVSSVNMSMMAWNPDLYEEVKQAKEYKHEAMADINESIDEAHVYKQFIEGRSNV